MSNFLYTQPIVACDSVPEECSVHGGSTDGPIACNGVDMPNSDEMVFSGGEWRSAILKDLEDGMYTLTV